jgi:SEC-C motif-containing protein
MTASALVSSEVVAATIDHFSQLDAAGDHDSMNALALRLSKEQTALLQFAAKLKTDHGDAVGEPSVFYATLVWAIFHRAFDRRLPRLLAGNLADAKRVVDEELAAVDGLADKPAHERVAPGLRDRQPHLLAKLQELIAEDVKESSFTAETAAIIFPPTQAIVEAFDAAVSMRRPGQNLYPLVREEPKVGRNDPCPCGSGKKFKRCHGGGAAET